MNFAKGHNGFYGAEESALTSAVRAQQSMGEVACAVMSEHLAQKSGAATGDAPSEESYFRYE